MLLSFDMNRVYNPANMNTVKMQVLLFWEAQKEQVKLVGFNILKKVSTFIVIDGTLPRMQ